MVSDNHEVRDFLDLCRPDPLAEALVDVHLRANSSPQYFLKDGPCVFLVSLGDGKNLHLHGGEPRGETALEMFQKDGEEAFDRTHDGAVYHDDALLLAALVDAGEVEALRQVHIKLNGRHLMLPPDGVGRHEVELGAVERGLAGRFDIIGVALFCYFAERGLGVLPYLFGAEVFFRLFRVVEGEARADFEAEGNVEHVDDIPQAEKFLLDLRVAAKYVAIVLRDREDAREAAELARLLVAVDHGGLGVALGHLAVAVGPARKYLRVVRAVHRLQRIFAALARGDTEKVFGEFVPMSRLFVQFLLGDVRDGDALVAARRAHFPDEAVQFLPHDGAARGPEGKPRADKVGGGEKVELLPDLPMVGDGFFFVGLLCHGAPNHIPNI